MFSQFLKKIIVVGFTYLLTYLHYIIYIYNIIYYHRLPSFLKFQNKSRGFIFE